MGLMTPMLFILAVCSSVAAAGPAVAEIEYPWCANFADGAGANCGFTSYEQCLKTSMPGTGGTCDRNPFYKGPSTEARKPAAHNRRRPH
jgi:hypothetical protein